MLMPRITRIRIVGCKYDGFRKYHEDSLYNLTRDGEPDHTLFTLKNQGGKGVFMQLLSQIAIPETKWGKQGGNKLTGMFYDHKNRFRPYTFHIIIEWKLDTTPEKWLLTGMCITAVKRNYSDEEETEERAGLNYFLYTYEHDGNGVFSIENIPVYDSQTRKVVEYDEFEQFIKEHQKYFIKYSRSSVRLLDSDYYNYLKSRGIYRSEWEILKLINKYEGGVGNYFSKAADNKAVFDRFIIPAISQNMKNYCEGEQDSLKGIFKSNLSITKNLPVLIEREQDYKNLLTYIEPLIQSTEIGQRWQQILNRCIEQGNNLYAGLKNRLTSIEKRMLTWQQEINKTETQIQRLEYEKDNLEYAREHRKLKELNIQNHKLSASFRDLEDKIKKLEIDKKCYKISYWLLKIKELEKKKQANLKKREQLIQELGLKDVEQEMQSLKKSIQKRWENTQKHWEQIGKDHISYTTYLDSKICKLEKDEQKEDKAELENRVFINQFERDKKSLENEQEKLSKIFNPLKMALPEMLLEELQEQDSSERADINCLKENIEGIRKKTNESKIEQKSKEKDIEYKQLDVKKLKTEYNVAKDEEGSLKVKICNELNLNIHNETYRKSWLDGRHYDLKKLILEKELKLDKLKQNLWENSIDKSLNQEDYWVPNKDVLSIKKKIEELGIKVQLGTEFLNYLGSDEKIHFLEKFPSIIHGVVIGNMGDWELLKENLREDIFLRSSVPIYIRSTMQKKGEYAFQILTGDEKQLALDLSSYIRWKAKILDRDRKMSESITVLSQRIESLRRLVKDIEYKLDKESSETILTRLKEDEGELEGLKLENIKLREIINDLEEKINKYVHKLDNLENQNHDTNQKINILAKFVENLQQIKTREVEIAKVKERLEAIKFRKAHIKKNILNYKKSKDNDVENFTIWEIQAKNKIKTIKEIIGDASFIEYQVKSDTIASAKQPTYMLIDEDFLLEISSWDNLSKDLEQRNNQISLINKDIEYIGEKLADAENNLLSVDKDWEQYEIIEGTKDSLIIKKELITDELEKTSEVLQQISMEKVAVSTKIDETNKQLGKIERKIKEEHKRASLIWADVNLDKKEYLIKKELRENKEYLTVAQDVIANCQDNKAEIKEIISDIRIYQELDFNKGKINKDLMARIKNNPRQEVELWIDDFDRTKGQLYLHNRKVQKDIEEFTALVKEKAQDYILKNRILTSLQDAKVDRYSSNLDSFNSMKNHFQKEINSISTDKAKAEEIRNTWAERASRHAIAMVESLKEMVSGMNYVNENGYIFPLLKLRGQELLPKDEQDVFYTLRDYFVESIGAIIQEYDDIENVDDKKIDRMMGDQAIFSRAVRGKYPTLMVYKMTEKNEFKYAKPHDYYYTTWEAINKGEGDRPEGSGGQTLSVSTFVIMMLMNYKKRYVGNDNPWTVLMLDNPFGSASGSHVLDPIFEIADKLNFQIIAFAAPEIIKAEISERFPVFWALNIGDEDAGKSGVVTGRVVHGGRVNRI